MFHQQLVPHFVVLYYLPWAGCVCSDVSLHILEVTCKSHCLRYIFYTCWVEKVNTHYFEVIVLFDENKDSSLVKLHGG